MQPAEVALTFKLDAGTASNVKYIDIGQCLSFVNRRLYNQGYNYYVSRVTYLNGSGGGLNLLTLPDTWVTSNAWVKAKALWNNMNNKVLKDNPSTQGKWADFKVFFDAAHRNGGTASAGPTLNLLPIDGSNTAVEDGEWVMSEYVQPQHNVNAATGEVLAADEYTAHMLGPDVAGAGAPDLIKSAGIIHGYADTRARVQAEPAVPGDMSTSWMTLLTDDGSQEPELAQLIEDQNDLPPYAETNYPGGDTNFIGGVAQTIMVTTTSLAVDKDLGFKVPLGLIKVVHVSQGDGNLILHLTPGHHKGVMCSEVKQ